MDTEVGSFGSSVEAPGIKGAVAGRPEQKQSGLQAGRKSASSARRRQNLQFSLGVATSVSILLGIFWSTFWWVSAALVVLFVSYTFMATEAAKREEEQLWERKMRRIADYRQRALPAAAAGVSAPMPFSASSTFSPLHLGGSATTTSRPLEGRVAPEHLQPSAQSSPMQVSGVAPGVVGSAPSLTEVSIPQVPQASQVPQVSGVAPGVVGSAPSLTEVSIPQVSQASQVPQVSGAVPGVVGSAPSLTEVSIPQVSAESSFQEEALGTPVPSSERIYDDIDEKDPFSGARRSFQADLDYTGKVSTEVLRTVSSPFFSKEEAAPTSTPFGQKNKEPTSPFSMEQSSMADPAVGVPGNLAGEGRREEQRILPVQDGMPTDPGFGQGVVPTVPQDAVSRDAGVSSSPDATLAAVPVIVGPGGVLPSAPLGDAWSSEENRDIGDREGMVVPPVSGEQDGFVTDSEYLTPGETPTDPGTVADTMVGGDLMVAFDSSMDDVVRQSVENVMEGRNNGDLTLAEVLDMKDEVPSLEALSGDPLPEKENVAENKDAENEENPAFLVDGHDTLDIPSDIPHADTLIESPRYVPRDSGRDRYSPAPSPQEGSQSLHPDEVSHQQPPPSRPQPSQGRQPPGRQSPNGFPENFLPPANAGSVGFSSFERGRSRTVSQKGLSEAESSRYSR